MHGNIYEIELLHGYGYGYVQVLIASEVGLDAHVLIRTLDNFSNKPYNGEASFFENIDELVYPSISLVLPKTRGANKWRLIGNLNVPKDFKVPKFKADFSSQSWENPDWENISWYIITNLIANGLDNGYKYRQVKHLPFWKHCTPLIFRIKLTMFWIKKHNKNIKDFFNLEAEYNYGVMYNEVINSVFYSDIDKKIRGTPLPV
jgi:hypothetical protein